VFVLLSDFLDPAFDRTVRRVSLRHDLVAVRVQPQEMPHPPSGLWISLADAETGEAKVLPPEQSRFLNVAAADRGRTADRRLRSAGAEVLAIGEDEDPVPLLARFMGRRRGNRRGMAR